MSRTNPALITKLGLSSHDKLSAMAKKAGRPVDQTATLYGLEAAIRRIFQGDHAERFGLSTSLKGGALMFFAEGTDPLHGRGTTDIDIQLGGFDGTMEDLRVIMREALASVPVIDDGVRFDVDAIKIKSQREGGVPGGKLTTAMQIGKSVYTLSVDVGFYDPAIKDTLIEVDFPSMLDMPPIRLYRQPIEHAVSDKCHAAHQHGIISTRLRDYYDTYVYLTKCVVDDGRLAAAFQKSWPIYGTPVPESLDEIEGYSEAFVAANAKRWQALRAGSKWAVAVPDLADVVALIRSRVGPAIRPGAFRPALQ